MVSVKIRYITEAGAHECATLDDYLEFLKTQIVRQQENILALQKNIQQVQQ